MNINPNTHSHFRFIWILNWFDILFNLALISWLHWRQTNLFIDFIFILFSYNVNHIQIVLLLYKLIRSMSNKCRIPHKIAYFNKTINNGCWCTSFKLKFIQLLTRPLRSRINFNEAQTTRTKHTDFVFTYCHRKANRIVTASGHDTPTRVAFTATAITLQFYWMFIAVRCGTGGRNYSL